MRVYVSSTFLDLADCRKVVHTTLRKLRQDDVAMEYYVAESDRPVDVCLRDVRESELYIGLFAWRYGYVPDGYTQSITELEYRAAMDAGIPCLIFLLREDAMWPRNMVDRGAAADSIEAFRAELGARHTVAFFGHAQELGTLVAAAVSRHLVKNSDISDQVRSLDTEVVRQYFERLRQQYGRLDLDALTPPEREEYLQIRLESVFVEQYVREDPPPVEVPRELLQRLLAQGEIDEDELPAGFDVAQLREAQEAYRAKPQVKAIEAIQNAGRCVVILGDPGSGKSTLARFLMLNLAGLGENLGTLTGHLPLLVELKRYVAMREEGTCQSIVGFLDRMWDAQRLGVAQTELEPYLAAGGPALAVFDGLDEVFDPRRREEITNEIAAFALRCPSVRIVVTSRITGYSRSLLTNAGFLHFTLQDLDEDQIGEFLRSWYSLALFDRPDQATERQARLLLAVQESRPIRELAGNPLLLTILAIIGKHQALPRERWKVYDHAARVLVQHWDVRRQLQDSSPIAQYIGEDDKREMLRRVAWSMQTAEAGIAGNFIHSQELRRLFEKYLIETYASDPATAKVLAARMIDQFRERNFILSMYGPHLYGFVHRAFLEFFCADSIVQRFQRDQKMSLDELVALFGEHAHEDEWREILRLITSVLAEHHTSAVIEQLLRLDRPWPVRIFEDRLPHGLALAAQCLAEVRNPRAVESGAAVLNEIVLLLEHCVGIEDEAAGELVEANIIPAVRMIGTAWPDRDAFAAWYERRGCRIVWAPISKYIAQLAAIVLADRPEAVSQLFVTADINDHRARNAVDAGLDELRSRSSQPAAPGAGNADPTRAPVRLSARMFQRLKDFTSADHDRSRKLGVVLLDLFAPDDPRVTEVLRDRVRHESDNDVLHLAAKALLRRSPGDPEVREVVLNNAMNGGSVPVDLVRENWSDDPDFRVPLAVFSPGLLSDEDAAEAIAGVTAEKVVDVLLTIVGDDDMYQYRHNSVVLLDSLVSDDPRIVTALRDRLREDTDDDVFRAAAKALLRRFPEDPEVRDAALSRVNLIAAQGRWQRMISELVDAHWPDDAEFRVLLAMASPGLLSGEDAAEVVAGLFPGASVDTVVEKIVATLGERSENYLGEGYVRRYNSLVLLDRLAPDDPRVVAALHDRLRHDPDDDVFRFTVEALLRRFPDDPSVRQVFLERARSGGRVNWGPMLLELAEEYRPDDFELRAVATVFSSDLLSYEHAVEMIAELPPGEFVGPVVDTLSATIDGRFDNFDDSGYVYRTNAVVLLDALAADDSRVVATARDRLRNDDDDDVFRVAAEALLRRSPGDPEVRAMVLEKLLTSPATRWLDSLSDLVERHWPNDTELRVLLVINSASRFTKDEDAFAELPSSISVEMVVDKLLRRNQRDLDELEYRLESTVGVLFDALFRSHPQTGAILRGRLREDAALGILPVIAEALLRQHPGDPAVRQAILDKATSRKSEEWRDALYALATEHWPNDPAFDVLQDGSEWGDVRRQVARRSVDMAQLSALDKPGPQDLPLSGFRYF